MKKGGAVVSFLALLELNKESMIKLTQAENFSVIYLERATAYDETVTTDFDAAVDVSE